MCNVTEINLSWVYTEYGQAYVSFKRAEGCTLLTTASMAMGCEPAQAELNLRPDVLDRIVKAIEEMELNTDDEDCRKDGFYKAAAVTMYAGEKCVFECTEYDSALHNNVLEAMCDVLSEYVEAYEEELEDEFDDDLDDDSDDDIDDDTGCPEEEAYQMLQFMNL